MSVRVYAVEVSSSISVDFRDMRLGIIVRVLRTSGMTLLVGRFAGDLLGVIGLVVWRARVNGGKTLG